MMGRMLMHKNITSHITISASFMLCKYVGEKIVIVFDMDKHARKVRQFNFSNDRAYFSILSLKESILKNHSFCEK